MLTRCESGHRTLRDGRHAVEAEWRVPAARGRAFALRVEPLSKAQGARVGFIDIDAAAGSALADTLADARSAPLFVEAD